MQPSKSINNKLKRLYANVQSQRQATTKPTNPKTNPKQPNNLKHTNNKLVYNNTKKTT